MIQRSVRVVLSFVIYMLRYQNNANTYWTPTLTRGDEARPLHILNYVLIRSRESNKYMCEYKHYLCTLYISCAFEDVTTT